MDHQGSPLPTTQPPPHLPPYRPQNQAYASPQHSSNDGNPQRLSQSGSAGHMPLPQGGYNFQQQGQFSRLSNSGQHHIREYQTPNMRPGPNNDKYGATYQSQPPPYVQKSAGHHPPSYRNFGPRSPAMPRNTRYPPYPPPNPNCPPPFVDFTRPHRLPPPFINPVPERPSGEMPGLANQVAAPNISGSPHNSSSKLKSDLSESSCSMQEAQQKEQDLVWIQNFTEKLSKSKSPKRSISDIKIHEAQMYLKEALNLRTELKMLLSHSQSDFVHIEPNFRRIKARLSEIEKIFHDQEKMSCLHRRIRNVKKKRARLRRVCERKVAETQEAEDSRKKISDEIDGWIEGLAQKQRDAKRAQELKKDADQILGEVRRKQVEAKRGLDLLKALTKLRQVRKEKAHSKGVYISGQADQTYTERLDILQEMWQKQLQTYEEEQRVLEVMMEVEHKENTQRETQKTRQKDERKLRDYKKNLQDWLFGKNDMPSENDPMFLFRHFYESANHSLESLIRIRQEWDIYLSTQGSGLPSGWASPEEPSSDVWATALKDDKG